VSQDRKDRSDAAVLVIFHSGSARGVHRYAESMAAVDLDHPPEGVVILPERGVDDSYFDPRAWVQAVRRRPRAGCGSRPPG